MNKDKINEHINHYKDKLLSNSQKLKEKLHGHLKDKKEDIAKKIRHGKPMTLMLFGLFILFGLIFGYKLFGRYMMMKHMSSMGAPIVTVAALPAKLEPWHPILKSPGTVSAFKGVDVSTEVSGIVVQTNFKGGEIVPEGELLVLLNDDAEVAQLKKLQADEDLAKIVYERDKAQYAVQAVSKAVLDAAEADLRGKSALVIEQQAIIAKKNIRAPFAGKLGIKYINLGQYLNPGIKIVTLQQLDPVYVYFSLPQVNTLQLKTGQTVRVTADGLPNRVFTGVITTIDPRLNEATRNLDIESVVENPENLLLPGMFTHVEVSVGGVQTKLTLPQTAVSFNAYGDIVYILKGSDKKDQKGKPIYVAQQTFVTLGERRGDQVAVLKGIKEGDLIVVAGQNKLKNGSQVVINNEILPTNNAVSNPVRD